MSENTPDDNLDASAPDTQEEESSEQKLIGEAKKRFDESAEAWHDIRRDALDDVKFLAGEQWPDDLKRARDIGQRPCLTINRLPQFLRQVTNDQRQNRPSIKVNPVNDTGDVETAKIYSGLIRHIEYDSNADHAYDRAFEGAAGKSFGWFRIVSEYSSPDSFNQDLKIKSIANDFSVYPDPSFKEPDGSDMNWCLVIGEMSKDEFEAEYPDCKLSRMPDWETAGDQKDGWITKESVRVAEYYYKEYQEQTLLLLQDGSTVVKEGLDPKYLKSIEKKIKDERKAQVPTVKWCKINGLEILDQADIPGPFIPVIPVLGGEAYVDGKRRLESLVRHAKDSQRMYNYWASAQTETIALAPRAPFIGYEGQFEGHEREWKTANIQNHAYLEVKPMTIGGQPAPLPQRNVYEPPVQAITAAKLQAADDLKATTGIYDASLGNKSNEQSGVAIQRRNIQSQTANYHLIDNLTRSIRHAGRILVAQIPHIYDAARAVRVVSEDDQHEVVMINQEFERNGKAAKYLLGVGKYDVTISTGPSYQTKREEAVASMLDLIKAYPPAAQVSADLMVRNMDWPGAQDIADRLKKILPPGMADDKDMHQPLPPQAVQQLQQQAQLIQHLTQELKAHTDMTNQNKLELESKERIALINAETQLKIALMKTDSAEAIEGFRQEVDMIHKRLDLIHEAEPIGQEIDSTSGPQGSATPANNTPTGGPSPGQPME